MMRSTIESYARSPIVERTRSAALASVDPFDCYLWTPFFPGGLPPPTRKNTPRPVRDPPLPPGRGAGGDTPGEGRGGPGAPPPPGVAEGA